MIEALTLIIFLGLMYFLTIYIFFPKDQKMQKKDTGRGLHILEAQAGMNLIQPKGAPYDIFTQY